MQLDADIEQLFSSLPLLAAVPRAAWRISALGGITNRSYRLQATENDLVLRWPGASASRYLDRRAEPVNAQAVAELGLAPPVLAADPDAGWYITAFVTGAKALSAADLAERTTFTAVLGLLTRLHRSAVVFPFQQGLFKAIDLYIDLAPTGLMQEARRALEPARLALLRNPMPRIACHVDPNPANFLRLSDLHFSGFDVRYAFDNVRALQNSAIGNSRVGVSELQWCCCYPLTERNVRQQVI